MRAEVQRYQLDPIVVKTRLLVMDKSEKWLAYKVGCQPKAIYAALNGRPPTLHVAVGVSKALGMPVEKIIKEVE